MWHSWVGGGGSTRLEGGLSSFQKAKYFYLPKLASMLTFMMNFKRITICSYFFVDLCQTGLRLKKILPKITLGEARAETHSSYPYGTRTPNMLGTPWVVFLSISKQMRHKLLCLGTLLHFMYHTTDTVRKLAVFYLLSSTSKSFLLIL